MTPVMKSRQSLPLKAKVSHDDAIALPKQKVTHTHIEMTQNSI